MYFKFRKQKGFTIIEALISLAIFAIIVAPISMMVLNSVKINKQSEEKQQSMMIVQNLVESIKSLSDEELLNESSLKISNEEALKIIKKENSESFNISGSSKGYEIEGYILPLNKYQFNTNNSNIRKNINIYVSENINPVLNIEDKDENILKKIYLNNKSISIVKKSGNILIVNNEEVDVSNQIDDIGIFIDKSCKDNYELMIKNDDEKESNLYIFKKETSNATYNINNAGGVFNIYSNIIIPDEEYSNNNRLYEIYVKAKKGKDVFESYSYKNIK